MDSKSNQLAALLIDVAQAFVLVKRIYARAVLLRRPMPTSSPVAVNNHVVFRTPEHR